MDDALRYLVSLINDTGMRLSGAAGLIKSDFNVDCDHLHLVIQKHSHRSLCQRSIQLLIQKVLAAYPNRTKAARPAQFYSYRLRNSLWTTHDGFSEQ